MTFSEGTAVGHAPDDYLPKPFEPREWPGLSTADIAPFEIEGPAAGE